MQKESHIYETDWVREICLLFSKNPLSHIFRTTFKLNLNCIFLSVIAVSSSVLRDLTNLLYKKVDLELSPNFETFFFLTKVGFTYISISTNKHLYF